MTTKTSNVLQTLAELGVSGDTQVPPLFAELRAEFDRDAAAVNDEALWKEFRDAWLGRKSGVLAHITDNWLKPAPPERSEEHTSELQPRSDLVCRLLLETTKT